MCGLVGVFGFGEPEPAALEIDALIAMMARRGPDDAGSWRDHRCALGFRRLAILDLSPAGHQPMASRDGRYHLVFNGEIYNYRELRAELEAAGHAFVSSGDTEVLLHALIAWGGVQALPRLNGMFALALYDAVEGRLLLARDHVGIKPLHIADTSKGIVFGSQSNQVLGHPWSRDLAIDRDALALYLRFGFIPAPFGVRRHTGQLQAGEWLEATSTGNVRRGRYYRFARRGPMSLRGDAALDAFDAALASSVKRQLASDVPLGVFLSGGVDSPLVAAEARAQHGGGLKAFTIGVEDARIDEAADAARIAGELGVEHVLERITANDALGLLDDVIAAATEPTADYSMFPTMLVSRVARKHVTVALSGDGGDELFWGYPSRFIPVLEQARYFRLPVVARYGAVAARRLGRGRATRDILTSRTVGELVQRKHTLLPEADLAQLFPDLPPMPARFELFRFDGTNEDDVAQWTRWNELELHLARVLAKVDRASMHQSLEVRVPLLDREVMDVAQQIDWRSCLDLAERRGKLLLRRSLDRRVAYRSGAKKGFSVPMAAWLRGPLSPLLHEELVERDALVGMPLERAHVRHLVARLAAGDDRVAWGLWVLLSLALWHRVHVEHRTCT